MNFNKTGEYIPVSVDSGRKAKAKAMQNWARLAFFILGQTVNY